MCGPWAVQSWQSRGSYRCHLPESQILGKIVKSWVKSSRSFQNHMRFCQISRDEIMADKKKSRNSNQLISAVQCSVQNPETYSELQEMSMKVSAKEKRPSMPVLRHASSTMRPFNSSKVISSQNRRSWSYPNSWDGWKKWNILSKSYQNDLTYG